MRSGGRRGLQIRRSGVFDIRGGFDSHAFPPILSLLAALLLGGQAGSARAQSATARPAPPDSAVSPPTPVPAFQPAPPDTGGPVFRTVPDTSATSDAEAERVLQEVAQRRRDLAQEQQKHKAFSEPRYVMFRSALIPGWG